MASTYKPAPTWLPATDITDTSVYLHWNTVSGIDSYRVFMQKEGELSTNITKYVIGMTSYKVTGLLPGKKYVFQVDGKLSGTVYPNLVYADFSVPLTIFTTGGSAIKVESLVMPNVKLYEHRPIALDSNNCKVLTRTSEYATETRTLQSYIAGPIRLVSSSPVPNVLNADAIEGLAINSNIFAVNHIGSTTTPSGTPVGTTISVSDITKNPIVNNGIYRYGDGYSRSAGVAITSQGIVGAWYRQPFTPEGWPGGFVQIVNGRVVTAPFIVPHSISTQYDQGHGYLILHPDNNHPWFFLARDSSSESAVVDGIATTWGPWVDRIYNNFNDVDGEFPKFNLLAYEDRIAFGHTLKADDMMTTNPFGRACPIAIDFISRCGTYTRTTVPGRCEATDNWGLVSLGGKKLVAIWLDALATPKSSRWLMSLWDGTRWSTAEQLFAASNIRKRNRYGYCDDIYGTYGGWVTIAGPDGKYQLLRLVA